MRISPSSTDALNKGLAWIFLIASLVYFTYLAWATELFFGGADEIVHYWMSRHSWQHPLKFLDLWGKPLYTLLSSPFSQFGFESLRLFNVIVGLLTAFLVYRILKESNVRHAWLGIPLTLASPVYFALMSAALTEALFSLILVFGLLLFLREKHITAAFVLSMLPFSRNEGFVILMAFGLLFIWRREFRSIPFLLSGYLIFSLIGWIVFSDFLWLWHQNPYQGGDIYGRGELLHFVKEVPRTTGLLITLFAALGWMILLLPKPWQDRLGIKTSAVLWGSLMPFALFFGAHSLIWWYGHGLSLGLTRVIGAVTPLLSIPAAWLLSGLTSKIKSEWIQFIVLFLVLTPIIIYPFKLYHPPQRAWADQTYTKEAATWFKESPYSTRILYYYDPRFLFYTDRDPYNVEYTRDQLPNKDSLSMDVPVGSIVAWDAHFGNNEGKTPRKKIMNDRNFRLVKQFMPVDTIWVLNHYPFEILLFERIEGDTTPVRK